MARWILVFRNTCDDERTGACSSGTMLLSTYKLSVERGACWRIAELSDRSTSLVCRVPVICLNQRRTHLCTPPGQTTSEFNRFPWRQGSLFPSKHSGVAIAIRENTFLPANVRRIYTPPAPLAGRGASTEAGQRICGFSDHEFIPAAVPIEFARETT